MTERVRKILPEMHNLRIKDTQVHPHPVEIARWQEDGLIEIDADASVFVLTAEGRRRCKACCATCGSWHQLPMQVAGGNIGECHHGERRGSGLDALRPPRSLYYQTCEVHWPSTNVAKGCAE